MAPLPRPRSSIPDLVYAAYEARAEDWGGLGFSPSMLGTECDRALWYLFRWASAKEKFSGRMLRLFQTGHIEEERIIADLRMAGIEVLDVDPANGRQWSARALAGHVRGKLDGIIPEGVPEAPTKAHVLECKSHSDKSFGKVKVHGVHKGKFEHWVQCQIYMHVRGIDRALYAAVNKNTDEVYYERVEYDNAWCVRLFARLERIIAMDQPPVPISEKREAPDCRFCKAKPLCLGESFARVNCRTCLHATPLMSGDAAWDCSRWAKPLSADEQRAACPAHLFIPALVPGEQIDVDEERETVTYTLRDGRTWIDGEQPSPEPIANPESLNVE
jgi:hypothetical protein